MQIVGYERPPDPALLLAEEGTVRRVDVTAGSHLEYGLGERRCAGAVDGERHTPCSSPDAPWCREHADTWVCARCRGECLKDEMDCHQTHVVYLAIVAPDAVKVGVTKAARYERRLLEQGADRGARIHEVENGRIAREIEAEIAADIPDRISVSRKIAGLGRSVDEDVWERTIQPFDASREHRPEHDCSVDAQPIPETLASGRVIGTKGRLVIFEAGASRYVTDLRELVGHEVDVGARDDRRQSGLGAFA